MLYRNLDIYFNLIIHTTCVTYSTWDNLLLLAVAAFCSCSPFILILTLSRTIMNQTWRHHLGHRHDRQYHHQHLWCCFFLANKLIRSKSFPIMGSCYILIRKLSEGQLWSKSLYNSHYLPFIEIRLHVDKIGSSLGRCEASLLQTSPDIFYCLRHYSHSGQPSVKEKRCFALLLFCKLCPFSLIPIKWHICILLGNALVFIASGGRFGAGPYRTGESIQPNCFQPWKWVAPAWLNSSPPFWWHGGGWHLKGCWPPLFYFRDEP